MQPLLQITVDMSLDDEADAFWETIDEVPYQFDRATREIAELRRITLKDIKPWYAKYVSPASRSRRKLLIQVHGREAPSKGGGAPKPGELHTLGEIGDPLAASRHHKVNSHEVVIVDIALVKRTLEQYPNCNTTQPSLAVVGSARV